MAKGNREASHWKHFFLATLKRNRPINADNLYVNRSINPQRGGASENPIKLVTPTMQITDQARNSLQNPSDFKQLTKSKRKIRKNGIKKGKGKKTEKKPKAKNSRSKK